MGLTPMMQQYLAVHEEVPDAILLYRLGDFYEMFFDDALTGSRILDLTLTGRDCGLEERAPMCGVPYHSAESYIARLVEAGHKVAICEQVEDPALAKGLVKREIIKIVTPGTITDSEVLSAGENHYIMAVASSPSNRGKRNVAFSVLDLSTGRFLVSEYAGKNYAGFLSDALAKYQPSEILMQTTLYDEEDVLPEHFSRLTRAVIEPFPSEKFKKSANEKLLKDHFQVFSLSALGLEDHAESVKAAGALLGYIIETQKTDLSHIDHIDYVREDSVMRLDAASRQNLEITKTIRGGKKTGTLLSVVDHTRTAAGSRLLKDWLEGPLIEKEKIDSRLDRVSALHDDPVGLTEIREVLSGIRDMERIASKITTTGAVVMDLIALKNSAESLNALKDTIESLRLPLISEDFADFDTLEDLEKLIDESIQEPGGEVKRFSKEPKIKEGYNEELDRHRDMTENGKDYLMQIEASEREKTGISNLKVKYNKVFGYFIEVSNGKKDLVPERYIRKQTLVNSERYFTEELKKTEDEINQAQDKLEILEAELFQEILEKIKQNVPRIMKAAKTTAELDAYAGLADLALEENYVRPEITEDDVLEIEGGRHPVVEKMTGRASFISNNTHLSPEKFLVLLTGPNMAGKSTYIRQVALITLLAQAGSFVPAKRAVVGIRDRIFTRVGASDDLATGQSTFMVEMTEVSNILRNATKKSLVILDEIGRGTSTFDGVSIAWAISEDLEKRGISTLFATHYHELTELDEKLKGVVNYSIAVEETKDGVAFLRKVRPGAADQSYGIEVAKLAGFPKRVTDRAQQILDKLEENQILRAPERNISMFDLFEKKTDEKKPEETSALSQKEREALDKLKAADPDDMRPREAQDLLYELTALLDS